MRFYVEHTLGSFSTMTAFLAAGEPPPCLKTISHLLSIPEDDVVMVFRSNNIETLDLHQLKQHGTNPNVETFVARNSFPARLVECCGLLPKPSASPSASSSKQLPSSASPPTTLTDSFLTPSPPLANDNSMVIPIVWEPHCVLPTTATISAPTTTMPLIIPTPSNTSPSLLPIKLHVLSTVMAEVADKHNNLLNSLAQLSAMMAKMIASTEAILAAVMVHLSVTAMTTMPSFSFPLDQPAFLRTSPSLHPYFTPLTHWAFVLTATQLEHLSQVEATLCSTGSMATVSAFDLCHPTIPGITPANNSCSSMSTCYHCFHQLWYEPTAHIQLPAHSLAYPRKPPDPWCQHQPWFALYYSAAPRPCSVLRSHIPWIAHPSASAVVLLSDHAFRPP